ncbi:MAG: PEGA domain-containing protein [Bacteroidetes bacterium]|nr:MAG: PEGA domain-containing protein [Bacteroidota bacterium]
MKKLLKTIKSLSVIFTVVVLFSACSSTTVIQSEPTGASLYLNEQPVGKTPYTMKDTKIVGTKTTIKLKKEGYETFNITIQKNEQVDVGAVVGGIFFTFPFIWIMEYNPVHKYELTPLKN